MKEEKIEEPKIKIDPPIHNDSNKLTEEIRKKHKKKLAKGRELMKKLDGDSNA
ncbi:MAG: hypothetical protein INQ03_17960 [Candidatus Heimdallarchaeota archaeon]|nr:hypothetical protein [Candidatus Heimdallarchaeota archaeon]